MLKLEHLGIAVRDGSAVSTTFKRLFGVVPYKTESVIREGVETLFIDAGGPKLELLESIDGNSAIAKYLDKRGEGLHHVAVDVDDIDDQYDRVRHEGFTVLSDSPMDGADGKRVFFVHPRDCHGILVEFCQHARTTWRPAEIEMPHGIVAAYSAGSTDAAPVLLLHDQDTSATEDFGRLLPTLERTLHVISFDAPGHGGSRGWDPGTSILRAADKHARAILNWYQIDKPAVIVGRGLAAEAVVQVAKSYPEIVQVIVLIDPSARSVPHPVDALAGIPILVCSLTSQSLDSAIEITRSFPRAHLSVIPELELQYVQLAEQIAAAATWT